MIYDSITTYSESESAIGQEAKAEGYTSKLQIASFGVIAVTDRRSFHPSSHNQTYRVMCCSTFCRVDLCRRFDQIFPDES